MPQAGMMPAVINPTLMNGTLNSVPDKKTNSKNAKVTLDKNGKPKRKKASRGGKLAKTALISSLSELSEGPFDLRRWYNITD